MGSIRTMMKSLHLLLLSLAALAAASPLQASFKASPAHMNAELLLNITKGLRHPSDLIFGGQKATRGQWPWQAFLYISNSKGEKFICGGSLLSKRHVLTAAHCTEDLASPSYAMLGLVNIETASKTPGVEIKEISSFKNYPDYTGAGSVYDDIAILTLKEEVELSEYVKIVKIKEDDSQLLEQKTDTVSGFGTYTYKNGETVSSPDLLYTAVDYIDHDWCKQRWAKMTGDEVKVWDRQICAGSDQKGAGPGDSGGPLQTKLDGDWFQIGLVSFGVNGEEESQNQADFPAVYTRVANYCDFIKKQTGGDFKCL